MDGKNLPPDGHGSGERSLNRLGDLFRVGGVINQKCSEFQGIFDLPRRFSVQSFGSIGSENHHVVVRIYHHLPLEGHRENQNGQKVPSAGHNSTSDGGKNVGCVSPVGWNLGGSVSPVVANRGSEPRPSGKLP